VVTPDGFPLYHEVFAGNTHDATAFPTIVETMERRFGTARRVWVLDRGIASQANLQFLKERKQSFLVGTPRSQLTAFEAELCTKDWQAIRPAVEVQTVQRDGQTYVLARSKQRRLKERAIRRRSRRAGTRLACGPQEARDAGLERTPQERRQGDGAGRSIARALAGPGAPGSKFASVEVSRDEGGVATRVTVHYDRAKLRAALGRDGAYLLLSDRTDWTAEQLWATYMQLTRAEEAFRAMKSNLLLRPLWHQLSGRVQAHVFVCVLAYALWKALDHLLHRTALMTHIRKPDPRRLHASPKNRPMSPAAALRLLHDVPIGDILLTTVEGRTLRLRRIARPNGEQAELLEALKLTLPERLCADRDVADPSNLGLPIERTPPKM